MQSKVSERWSSKAKDLRPVHIREASFEDHYEISDLETRYNLETKNLEEWRHLWVGNFAYRHFKSKWPIGWVLETDAGKIVGHVGNIPRWYEIDGRPILTAVTHAWVVDFSYRSYSPLLLDSYFRQTDIDLLLSTTVNSHASAAFTVFNSLRVPRGAWDRSLYRITNYRGFAKSWAAMKRWPLIRSVGHLAAVPLWCRDLSSRRPFNKSMDCTVDHLTGFDERFDLFWDKLRRNHPRVLLAVRSREAMEWQFKYALHRQRIWILTASDSAGMNAYAIFCRQDNPGLGLTRMRLVDYQTLSGDAAMLTPMMALAVKKCREQGIHMLEYVGFLPETQQAVRRLGFQPRQLPCWQYYYLANSHGLANSLAEPASWCPSAFDGDSSL